MPHLAYYVSILRNRSDSQYQTPDIEGMRVAGKLAAECLMMIEEHVKPGITTGELDRICHNYILNVQHAILRRLIIEASQNRSAPASTTLCVTGFLTIISN